jgi:hypothetical protein
MGTDMEVPGVAQHFHIAFDGSNSNPPASDLFLGDDNNYVKLPGYELNPTAQYGVEIGTNNRGLGPQNVEVNEVDELVPPGGVWRFFIDHDTYPNLGSAVSVGDTVTTSWGTPITATITDVVEEPGNYWKIHVAQDITAGFLDEGETVSFGASGDSHTWRFGTDGGLVFPDDTVQTTAYISGTNANTGNVVFDGNQMYVGGTGFLNLETDTGVAVIGTNGPQPLLVSINEDDKIWSFDPDGGITFPDATVQTTAYTGQSGGSSTVVRQDTAPTASNGTLWFNTVEGRLYIKYSDVWVDAAPLVQPPPDTDIDVNSITFPDATVQTSAYINRLDNGDYTALFSEDGWLRVRKPSTEQNYFNLVPFKNEDDTYGVQIDIDNQAGWSFLNNGTLSLPASSNDLYTTTNALIKSIADIQISAGDDVGSNWVFGGNGDLLLPQGSVIGETDTTTVITPPGASAGQSLVIRPTSITGITSNYPSGFADGDTIVLSVTPNNGGSVTGTVDYTFTGATSEQLGRALTGTLTFSNEGFKSITWTVPVSSSITTFTFTLSNASGFSISALAPYTLTRTGSSETSHVHLVAGDPTTTDLYLGDDDQYVKIEKNGGDVVIGTDANTKHWRFDETGTTTLPGAVVNSTVAKTGVVLPTTTGVVDTLAHDSVLTGLTDATYGPFTRDVVTFSVVVTSGVINSFSNITVSGDLPVNAVIGTLDSGDISGTSGTTITLTVATVVQATPTAIDLTKSINKLTDGVYTLANGVEGQIMYLVAQNGVVPTDVSVLVANSRNIGVGTLLPFSVYDNSDDSYYGNIGGFCTLIFTDGAWQQSGGAWGIIT